MNMQIILMPQSIPEEQVCRTQLVARSLGAISGHNKELVQGCENPAPELSEQLS